MPRGFWCEFTQTGKCADLVEGSPDVSPGPGYVWLEEKSPICLENDGAGASLIGVLIISGFAVLFGILLGFLGFRCFPGC